MISTWLGETSLERFQRDYFQLEPYAAPGTAVSATPLLDWNAVERLLASRPDVLVVRNARLHPDPGPPDPSTARALFAQGYSLVIRGCERHDGRLCELADSIGREFEGEVAVQAYVTPAGFQSFGWHYDCEDVFIAQTSGTKEYRLRRNTVNPSPTIDAMPRDMHFELETTPIISCTLIAGDWLYIPRGFWHVARATEDSLSLSVGVLGPAARGKAPLRHRAWDSPGLGYGDGRSS